LFLGHFLRRLPLGDADGDPAATALVRRAVADLRPLVVFGLVYLGRLSVVGECRLSPAARPVQVLRRLVDVVIV